MHKIIYNYKEAVAVRQSNHMGRGDYMGLVGPVGLL